MRTITRRTTTVVAAGLLTALVAGTAVASTVTQEVGGGSLTASLADLGLTAVDYSHADQTSDGSVQLTVDDSSASGAGWNVTVQSSAFVYTGDNLGTDIPAANFALTSVGSPVVVAGQDGDGAPQAVTQTGSLDVARTVIEAAAGSGAGNYTQDLGVALTVPGQSRAGTYTGTVTTTAASGPSA